MAITDDTTIKMDDGTEATIKELKDAYQRHSAYANNMAALMKDERQLDDEKRRFQLRCHKLGQFLGSLVPDAPDPALEKTNPEKYAEQIKIRSQAKDELNDVIALRDGVSGDEIRAKRKRHMDREQEKLLITFPRLKDPTAWEEFFAGVRHTATKMGFSAQELADTTDYRILKMLHYAGIGLHEAQSDGGDDNRVN